ncbi:phosphate signaling complex protein PhoU [Phytohabitans sp. ZYX-F-186]|uniref:Phosphate-specific transport system accessory protein PhoU n=1 Tax=Phytohabitans maris TaxID=3071409 RepID=A0ABU0ZI25_9ACTN|nr:phosphate signaling complex protein PhoU [Phytohabitans sp. ZYX-F-186]MDQ7906706.1 phosphate signaling complex protein PhoU [Phytohabitans sp. ZYX-F-186]
MRDDLRADLLEVGRLLVSMAEAVRTAMVHATQALLTADREICEAVIARDNEVDDLRRQVDQQVYDTLARQAPVATDLRLVVTGIQIAADLERMGDLAEHVAKTALRRYPAPAVPPELREVITSMGSVADRMAGKVGLVLTTQNALLGAELESDDDAMDELQRQLFNILLDRHWPHGAEAAIDGALLGRFYERYADHAVNAGQQVVYLVTGEPTEPPGLA